jgi:trehalose 6-phosphate synthase
VRPASAGGGLTRTTLGANERGRRRLIVVSNRGPVGYSRDAAGNLVTRRGAGGLVTALRPLVSRHDVTWIASAMTEAESALATDGVREETGNDGSSFRLRFVVHEPQAFRLFYDVIANPVLWFAQHGLWALKQDPDADLSEAWSAGYARVNAGFAAAVLDELRSAPDAAVLFQDYHLYLAPRLVREQAPAALLSHFVHIPWPSAAEWGVLPASIQRELHLGLLANDLVGFHTERWRRAFDASTEAVLGADAAAGVTTIAAPISVDVAEFEALAATPRVVEHERELRAGRPETLVVRVDRADPAKNAVRGFLAFERLLERRPDLHGRVQLVALLDPSRERIPEYRRCRDEIELTAQQVSRRFARDGWQPLRLDVRDDFPLSVAAYKQFDVLLVNSVRDGLNLVAKEGPLVNTRAGAVVLSREAGAYEELAPWVLGIDPYDVEGQADALEQALELPAADRSRRIGAMRGWIREHDLDAWSATLLDALERASTMRR